MIELIAWLGLVMLAVKLMEIASSNQFRHGVEHETPGALTDGAIGALWIGWVGVVAIGAMLIYQGDEARDALSGLSAYDSAPPAIDSMETRSGPHYTPEQMDCVAKAEGYEETLACVE